MEIYVGYLPWETVESELEELFKRYGEVTRVSIPRNRVTGRTRGFGFCVMPNESEALAAIKALDGFETGGRRLKVNKALPPFGVERNKERLS